MLTDNRVLLENAKELPAIMCAQKKAKKCIPTEEDMICANINSFGDDIGKITNRVTSMFEVMERFEIGSREYEILDYRIKCGQKYQQDAIDRAKGIISESMPKTWYDRRSIGQIEDEETRELYYSIVADRKPYFMRYIYPTLMNQYTTYIKNTDKKALREFRKTVRKLMEQSEDDLTEAEKEFLHYYYAKMPVGMNNCVMNRICRRIEDEFDHYQVKYADKQKFDYEIYRSEETYIAAQYRAIAKVYEDYTKRLCEFKQYAAKGRIDEDERIEFRQMLVDEFRKRCYEICSNEKKLCNILLDLCYQKEGTKQFVWDMAAEQMIENMLSRNGRMIRFPVRDQAGDIEFNGERFVIREKYMEEVQ